MGGDSFVMYLGDNLIDDGIRPLVEEYTSSNANSQILLAHVPNAREFGVAELEGGRVVRLIEKPPDPPSDLALVGVYMFDSNVFEAVNAIEPSARGELEITDAIQYLIDKGYRVESHIVSGWWKDTGKLEDMLEANRIILDTIETEIEGEVDKESRIEGRVTIGKGSRVIASLIRGPADHRRRVRDRELVRGTLYVDRRPLRAAMQRGRAQHHTRGLPGSRHRQPAGRQPDRQERQDHQELQNAEGLPGHAR